MFPIDITILYIKAKKKSITVSKDSNLIKTKYLTHQENTKMLNVYASENIASKGIKWGNVSQHNKGHIWTSQSYHTQWWRALRFFSVESKMAA